MERKTKYFPIFGVLFLFASILAFLFGIYQLEISPALSKSTSLRVSDDYTRFSAPIEGNAQFDFTVETPIYAFAAVFGVENEQPNGQLLVEIFDATNNTMLASSLGDMKNIIPGQYTGLGLNSVIPANTTSRYRVVLTPQYEGDGRLTLGGSDNDFLSSQFQVDNVFANSTPALLITTGQIGNFLARYYWFVCIAVVLLAAVAFVLVLLLNVSIHKVYAVLVVGFGLLFCLVLPPYAAPDEQYHINQSFTVASTWTSWLPLNSVPLAESYRRPSDHDDILQQERTTVFTWQHMINTLSEPSPDQMGEVTLYSEMQADDSDYLYFVSAAAVALGYLLKIGFTGTLLLGRFANLLVYAVLTGIAVWLTPKLKGLFVAIGLLPMCIHLAASFSRDCLTLSFAFLFTALVFNLAFSDQNKHFKAKLALLTLLGVLLASAKVVYIPLVCLVFLIPNSLLGQKAKILKVGFICLCVASLFLTGAKYTLLSAFSRASDTDQAEQTIAIAQSQEEADLWNLEEQANNPDNICFSPSYVLSHPAKTIFLVLSSVYHNSGHYLKTLVGGKLGYYNLEISWIWVLTLYFILAFSMLPFTEDIAPITIDQRMICLISGLACCGLVILGCITWTPTYYTEIYGLQGRYFLPAIPTLLAGLAPTRNWIRIQTKAAYLCPVLAILNLGVLVNCFMVIVSR